MPAKQLLLCTGIIAFFLAVLAFSCRYGPGQRSYLSPPRVVSVDTTEQLARTWLTSGVRGRTLVCFTRYLNAVTGTEPTAPKVTEDAMAKGIARRVYHVVPDSAWPEVTRNLQGRNGIRPFAGGYIGIFENGRVYIQPLSRFTGVAEKALIVLEPKVWSSEEIMRIAGKLSAGEVSTDLMVLIRGSEQDAATFRRALPR